MNGLSFSMMAANFWIGMSKGSRLLLPYSKQFTRNIGYRLAAVELQFRITSGRVAPDAVAESVKAQHVLLFEWTETTVVNDRKRRQIGKYAQTTLDDLITGPLAVPASVNGFDVVFTLAADDAVEHFQEVIRKRGAQFPIFVLQIEKDSKWRLAKRTGNFSQQETEQFFASELNGEKLPRRFVPFNLEQVAHAEIVYPVMSRIASLLTQKTREFGLEEICHRSVPIWKHLGVGKQNEIKKKTKDIFGMLLLGT